MWQIDEDHVAAAIEVSAAFLFAVMLVISWQAGAEDERRWTLAKMPKHSWEGRVVVKEGLTARECLIRASAMNKAECVEGLLR